MEIDKINKIRTYFIIVLFIIIILLSIYVVVDKINKKNKNSIENYDSNKITNNILSKSSLVTELSLNNKFIETLYNYTDNIDIEYILYLNKNKKLDWNVKSLIVSKNILQAKFDNESEITYIDKEKYEKIYSTLFEKNIDEYSLEDKTGTICGSASYDLENDIYVSKTNCKLSNNMVTFYKNITFKNDEIMINKYYIFLEKNLDNNTEEYDLYLTDEKTENNLLVANIKKDEIINYIHNMNVLTIRYIKSKDGNYYLKGIN